LVIGVGAEAIMRIELTKFQASCHNPEVHGVVEYPSEGTPYRVVQLKRKFSNPLSTYHGSIEIVKIFLGPKLVMTLKWRRWKERWSRVETTSALTEDEQEESES
jgi:hypothetical protein